MAIRAVIVEDDALLRTSLAAAVERHGLGRVVTPWLRMPGQRGFTEGSARITVASDGSFTWGRRTSKKVRVYVTAGATRSNIITIAAR